jgi:hypothetical protein
VAAELHDVRARLEGLAEELADLAMDRLREAMEGGDAQSAAEERRLTRARRAVEKAAAILGQDPD